MADVTLKITADASNAVKGIKDTQKEAQKLNDTANSLNKQMDALFQTQKKGFSTTKDIDAYTKAMESLKVQLAAVEKEQQALNEEQKKTADSSEKLAKTGNNMAGMLMNWAKGLVTVAAAAKVFREIIQSTDALSDKFAATLNGWKEGFSAMARAIANNDFNNFFKNVQNAVREGQRFAETEQKIADTERALKIRIGEHNTELKILRELQNDSNKNIKDRLAAGIEAEKIVKQNAKDELELARLVLDNEIKNASFKSKQDEATIKRFLEQEPMLMRQIEIGKEYNELLKQRDLLSQQTAGGFLNPADDPAVKAIMAKIAALGSEAVAYGELAKGLNNITDAQKDKIVADYEAIEVAKQAEINLRVSSRTDAMRAANAKETSKVLKEESDKQAKIIEQFFADWERETEIDIKNRAEMLKAAAEEERKAKEREWKFGLDLGKQQFNAEKKQAKEEYDLRIENAKKLEEYDKFVIEQRKENIQRLGSAVMDYLSIIEELSQREVDRTQRERELMDTRIDEAQSALETEVELYEAGYASNVAAKQKELDALKKARDKALKEEELARKKAHKMYLATVIAQKAVDVASIISSTAAANAKAIAASPLTFGQPWVSINTIAAALGIAAAVAAVAAANQAKFAKGGWTGEGKYRDETGERMAGVVHENEFVVKRGPAHKFRGVLEAINKEDRGAILNSFNKISPELLRGATINKFNNNVMVENSGPNSRLDQVVLEQRKLNARLTGDSVQEFGNMRVIRKGSTTRQISR